MASGVSGAGAESALLQAQIQLNEPELQDRVAPGGTLRVQTGRQVAARSVALPMRLGARSGTRGADVGASLAAGVRQRAQVKRPDGQGADVVGP